MNIQLNAFAVGSALLTVISAVVSLIIYIYGKTKIRFLAVAFSVAIIFWSLPAFFIAISKNEFLAFFWWRVSFVGVIFSAVFLHHITYVICNSSNKKILRFSYILGIFFAFMSLTGSRLMIADLRYAFSSFYYVVPGILYYMHFISWFLLVIYSNFNLYKHYKSEVLLSLPRSQIIYLVTGFICGFLGATFHFFPAFRIDIYPYWNFAISIYMVMFCYAVIKTRVLDIKVAIIRSFIFVFIYALVFGMPFWLGHKTKEWLSAYIITGIFIICGNIFYRNIVNKIELLFFKYSKQTQIALHNFALGTFNIKDVDFLMHKIVNTTCKILDSRFAGIYLLQEQEDAYQLLYYVSINNSFLKSKIHASDPLVCGLKISRKPVFFSELSVLSFTEKSESVIIPFIKEEVLFGFLVLGSRKNRAIYSPDDFKVFEILANQASLALQNALLIKEREELQAQRHHLSKMSTLGNIASGVGHNLNNRFNTLLTLINMHDLKYSRSPLTSDISKEELIKRQTELAELLSQIKAESERGFEIASILSKSAKQPVEPQAFYLEQAVKLAFDLIKAEKSIQQVKVIEDYPKNTICLYASLSHIQDVLFNIADNAYDALHEKERMIGQGFLECPAFSPTITITAAVEDAKALIIIADNGIGIAQETLSSIGDPFYSTKSQYRQGLGLGVWMAKRHLQMNKGDLAIASTYGEGTSVSLTLPLAHSS